MRSSAVAMGAAAASHANTAIHIEIFEIDENNVAD
jgi:hypothetical protein